MFSFQKVLCKGTGRFDVQKGQQGVTNLTRVSWATKGVREGVSCREAQRQYSKILNNIRII